jgi:hypothetical protein
MELNIPFKNFSLIETSPLPVKGAKFRPMPGAQGLWAGRDLYRTTPAVTWDLSFSGLIRRTSRLLRHTRGCGGSILTRILTDRKKIRECEGGIYISAWPVTRHASLPLSINANCIFKKNKCVKEDLKSNVENDWTHNQKLFGDRSSKFRTFKWPHFSYRMEIPCMTAWIRQEIEYNLGSWSL